MLPSRDQLFDFLEYKYHQYNQEAFINDDPVSIPHTFRKKEDIEIAGFCSAVIAWGSRKSIIKSAIKWMELMDNDPYEFIIHAAEKEFLSLGNFVHRTFQGDDCIYFTRALHHIYREHGGLEKLFSECILQNKSVKQGLSEFKRIFFSLPHLSRTRKHLPDPVKNATAKRINMYLRWMVREDSYGVDFGLWKGIPPSMLKCPLDTHSGRVARKLGLLERKANDWKAVEELTEHLSVFDPVDPVKYDIALFGLGVYEKF